MSEPYNLTNEEAINAIEKNMPSQGTYTVLTEALHMAIKALKKDIAILGFDSQYETPQEAIEAWNRRVE